MKTVLSLLIVIILHCNLAYASNITDEDCAIGGVVAGWHSSHHYLPEKFNKTGLAETEWLDFSHGFMLDNYPKNYVVGYHGVKKRRMTLDKSLILFGIFTVQSREAGNSVGHILDSIFNKSPMYIAAITTLYNKNIDKSFEINALNMTTPRGIKIGSSLNDMLNAYGRPDLIERKNDFECYHYYTSRTLQRKEIKKDYVGTGMKFFVNNQIVIGIQVYNTYGY